MLNILYMFVLKPMKGLTHFIAQIPDERRKQGQRVTLPSFLTMVTLSSMSGYCSLQAMARFMKNNEEFFVSTFGLLHGVPGYTRIRTLLESIDFEELNKAFYQWANQFMVGESNDWIAIDGKGLNSTIVACQDSKQNFHAMVSAFTRVKGISLSSSKYENKHKSEIVAARDLIKKLDEKGLILTLDAIHCQKKQRPRSWLEEMTM